MTYSPRWVLNGLDLTSSPFMVVQDSADPGAAETVSSILASMISDGDIELTQRRGNRTYEIPVVIEGGDRATIAAAQADLVRAAEQTMGTLEFDPGDGSDVTVFETFAGSVALAAGTDDTGANNGLQRYTVTLPCRPFVRPLTKETIDAPPVVGSTTTSVDTGSATTGWSLLSTAPAALKNLMSNPSFETNTTGWAVGGGTASLSRLSGTAAVGSFSLGVAESATTGRSYANSPAITVAAGNSYSVLLSHGGGLSVPTAGGGCLVRYYSDAGATVQAGGDWVTTFSTTAPWSTKSFVTPTAPAGAIRMRIFPFSNSSNGLGSPETWYLDAVLVSGGTVLGYGDGATTATAALTWAWDGTAHASTSTGTWTAPTLAVVSGAVKGTAYGQASAAIRRNNTGITAAAMATLPFIRIRGTASAYSDGQVTIADNGSALTAASYSYNATTGAFDILIKRAAGFTNLDVTFARTGGSISTTTGLFVAVDQIDITDNPFGTGKTQTRQVAVYGSQRTELSLAVLGLDTAGTTPVALGEKVLVHTAAAGDDSRAKFVSCRSTSGTGGTADATAASGAFNTLSTTTTPTVFTFAASTVLPGEYAIYTRLKATSAGARTISYAAAVDGAGALDATDPPTGWYTALITAATTYDIFPIGSLILPPAGIEDATATLSIKVAADTASVVSLDDVWLAHIESGQVTLLDTSGALSAVRIDAATVDAPQPSAWVGVATSTGTGAMLSAGSRIYAFDQHMAEPGLLQISTVTPGCATSRVSASYYPRFAHDVAPVSA